MKISTRMVFKTVLSSGAAMLLAGAFLITLSDDSVQTVPPKASEEEPGMIVLFNNAEVMGVRANTSDKDFKPVFEKELVRLSGELPGNPEFKITYWYTVINGSAIRLTQGPEGSVEKLMEALKKQPYVRSVERDKKISVDKAGG